MKPNKNLDGSWCINRKLVFEYFLKGQKLSLNFRAWKM